MKEKKLEKTKVVVRNLPPTIAESSFLEVLDKSLGNRYTWCRFCQGKSRPLRQVFSRAYVNLKSHEDVLSLYDNIDGRIFINERGVQFKAMVEYAPFQRVPKARTKRDAREGTIYRDSDYAAFLETLEKAQEMLPSAEVQLERREAEKAAALVASGGKDPIVVTPLMEFVRNRRAAKSAPVIRTVTSRQSRGSAAAGNNNIQKKERFRGDADKERGLSGEKRRKEAVLEGKERRLARELLQSGSTNLKSTGAAAPQLRLDDESMPAAVLDSVPSRGGASAAAAPPPRLAIPVAPSSGTGGDSSITPTTAKSESNSSRREGSKRQRQREREREKDATTTALAVASASDAPLAAPPKSPVPRQSPQARPPPQRPPSGHKSSDSAARSHVPGQHDAPSVGNTQPAPTSEGASESRRLRNKDRPDRPVWTPRRRGDSGPAAAAAAASAPSGSSAVASSSVVGLVGGKPAGAGTGTAAPFPPSSSAQAPPPLQPGSITILRRDSRTSSGAGTATSGQGQQSPDSTNHRRQHHHRSAVIAGDDVDSVSKPLTPPPPPSSSSSGPSPLSGGGGAVHAAAAAAAGGGHSAPPPPPPGPSGRGRGGGGRKGGAGQHARSNVAVADPEASRGTPEPPQGVTLPAKGSEAPPGGHRKGGRGRAMRSAGGDSTNPPDRDGGGAGSGRKSEGPRQGGKGSLASGKDTNARGGVGPAAAQNGMPPS